MIRFDFIEELEVVGVADPGVPNKERILLRTKWEIENIQAFMVGLGVLSSEEDAQVTPLRNYVFYFTHCRPEVNSWIILYTGNGEPQTTEIPTTGQRAYTFFWGFDRVLFKNPKVVPMVLRIAGIEHPGGAPLQLPGYSPTQTDSSSLEG